MMQNSEESSQRNGRGESEVCLYESVEYCTVLGVRVYVEAFGRRSDLYCRRVYLAAFGRGQYCRRVYPEASRPGASTAVGSYPEASRPGFGLV